MLNFVVKVCFRKFMLCRNSPLSSELQTDAYVKLCNKRYLVTLYNAQRIDLCVLKMLPCNFKFFSQKVYITSMLRKVLCFITRLQIYFFFSKLVTKNMIFEVKCAKEYTEFAECHT